MHSVLVNTLLSVLSRIWMEFLTRKMKSKRNIWATNSVFYSSTLVKEAFGVRNIKVYIDCLHPE